MTDDNVPPPCIPTFNIDPSQQPMNWVGIPPCQQPHPELPIHHNKTQQYPTYHSTNTLLPGLEHPLLDDLHDIPPMNGTLGITEDINITIRLQNTKAQLRKLENENDQLTRDIHRLRGMLHGEKAQGKSKT